jgi:Type IV secretory pathway, VirB3-like protein
MEGNPVPKAINHRVMPLGVPWVALMATLFLAVLMFNFLTKLGGIAFLILAVVLLRTINRKEQRFFLALKLWWTCGRHAFDAGARD